MLKKKKLFIILFLVFLQNSFGADQLPKTNKNVLVLFSLVPSTPAYRVILDGIRQQLTENFGSGYNLHTEYLETERYPKGKYPKEQFDPYNEKYRDVRLDLLICIGTDIIPAIKQNASEKLLRLPTISLDYEFPSIGRRTEISLNNKTTVFPINVDAYGTISAALALLPGTKFVYVFSGISNTDKIFLSITKEAVTHFRGDKVFSFFSDISMDDVLKKVHLLPPNSIILIPYFNVDSKMVPYYNPESIRLISRAANAPVFAYSDMGMGDGSVGGYIISFRKAGLKMGEAAVNTLMGADPNSVRITKNDYYEYLFDWRELQRWNIGRDLLPPQSAILFEEVTFFEKYKWILIGAIFFLLMQTFLIVSLIYLYRRQSLTANRLKEAENKFRELVREDRILSMGQMTASLSHELNQPLTAILSTAQAGIRFIDSGNPDPVILKDILQKIVENDKRTASILTSIRGMMKLEKREKEKVSLNSLVEDLYAIYRGEAAAHHVLIRLQLTNTPVFIVADGILIQQVILNFLSNAIHAIDCTDSKNKFITITETVENENVMISVRDSGTGIPAAMKPDLFKPFISSKKEGMGIGLSISRSIIDDHNGTIRAENIPGGGAEFSFSLKIENDE